jgi:hypothetical protein
MPESFVSAMITKLISMSMVFPKFMSVMHCTGDPR